MTGDGGKGASRGTAWLILAGGILAFILVPFFLWEAELTAWSESLVSGSAGAALLPAAVVLLLVADVVLPIPSSVVSTVAGFRFGLLGGALLSWLGMTAGCVVAYVLGSRVGRPATTRLVGPDAAERVAADARRHGLWSLVTFRAVPVLAEASVLVAGVGRMPFARFLTVTALANAGVSIAYAWVGARSARAGSFLLAFAGAILIPALAMALARGLRRQSDEPSPGVG